MSSVVVFDEFDAWEFYQLCIRHVEDREYCKEAAKLILEVQTGQPYAYGKKAQVVLPNYKRLAATIDRERRFVVIFLDIAVRPKPVPEGRPRLAVNDSRVVALIYERHGNGFRLKTVDWMTPEIRAMEDLHPSAFRRDST